MEDIEDMIRQLQETHIRQASLIERLTNATRQETEEDNREFTIGDQVTINNPRRVHPKTGTIIKIGRSRITVLTSKGTKITRAPKNLTLS